MQLIAHRGLTNESIKENTILSFLNAIKNNYDGIELDIRLTKDKELVCLHDKMINRTSNGKGNINNLTYKEVLKYNFGTKNKKVKIPRLLDVINNIDNSIVFIELKEKIELEILENILDKNNTNEYYICSFNKSYIDNIKNTKYKKGIINYVFNSNININDYDFVMILENLFNKDIYDKLKNNNVECVLYGTLSKINIKNKEIINDLKYIV